MLGSKKKNRPALTFLSCLVAMPTCVYFLPGISTDSLIISLVAGAILGVAYLLVRPIIRLLTMPVGCMTMGLFGFVIDSALILGLAHYVDGFYVENFLWALAAAFIVNTLCLITG